jgi:hypothetical protein
MIQIAISKVVSEQEFPAANRTGPRSGPVFVRNNKLYVPPRLLSNVILSQLMCHKYFSKTLEESLSRDNQNAFGT